MPMSGGRKTQLTLIGTPTRKYGSFSTNITISSVGAIASEEAIGSLVVTLGVTHPVIRITQLSPSALAGRRFSSFAGRVTTIDFSGIASAEVIGSLIVVGGTIVVAPSGIATAEAIGSHTVVPDRTLLLTGIASTETIGSHTLAATGVITPTAIGSGQKLALWNANTEPDLAGYRVYVGTVSHTYTAVYDVGLTATPSTPGYVIANLTSGTTYFSAVTAYDTSNNESAFSTEGSFVAPADIRFGDINLLYNNTVALTGITSLEAIGSHTLARGVVNVLPSGLASAEAIGNPIVQSDALVVSLVGVISGETFGPLTITVGDVSILCTGLASTETFGTPTLFGSQLLILSAIASAEVLGTPLVEIGTDRTVLPIPIPSGEAIGSLAVEMSVALPSITSAEAFGTTNVISLIEPTGIVSQEAIGSLLLDLGTVSIVVSGIATSEQIGAPLLIPQDEQLPVDLFPARDRQFTFPSTAVKHSSVT